MAKIAMMANYEDARCINPSYTPGDGDTRFASSKADAGLPLSETRP
jgi:L-aminopeptidase/D-esterase-like protein